jgi:hypothetical protein
MTGMTFRRLSKIAHLWRYKIAVPAAANHIGSLAFQWLDVNTPLSWW